MPDNPKGYNAAACPAMLTGCGDASYGVVLAISAVGPALCVDVAYVALASPPLMNSEGAQARACSLRGRCRLIPNG